MSATGFVLLRAGELRLALDRGELRAAEHMEGTPVATGDPGWFEHGAGRLAALSPALRPLAHFPRERFVVTRLRADGADVRLAWDEVRVLGGAPLAPRPLPPALRSADGPIDGYMEHEGEVLLCTGARRLLAHVQRAGATP